MKDDAEPVVVVAGLDGCCCDNEPYASELLLTYVVCVLKLSLATASVLKFGITRRPRSIFNPLYSIFIKTSIILPVLINVKQESLIGRVFDDVETIVVETIEVLLFAFRVGSTLVWSTQLCGVTGLAFEGYLKIV
ncbi:hypothetical protein BCR33DRAFT_431663 [Rhizoclosmatium globosum]|uniref:Uncharacterized protein n=1 Tax=Rhizoclosmatium globosum TaxID=329046 RepID=A0A1Y2BUN1_9FUNG|nr:hypothetical protein BCR33DRAFT_431663 [Rhizoclosmatium globosum]|eukprot:ORY38456.1 hypothetical protein BCR33DRAFT_431663 [Rhizoclosmatium globosum]